MTMCSSCGKDLEGHVRVDESTDCAELGFYADDIAFVAVGKIPVMVAKSSLGQFYGVSNEVPGLLVFGKSVEEVIAAIPKAVAEIEEVKTPTLLLFRDMLAMFGDVLQLYRFQTLALEKAEARIAKLEAAVNPATVDVAAVEKDITKHHAEEAFDGETELLVPGSQPLHTGGTVQRSIPRMVGE